MFKVSILDIKKVSTIFKEEASSVVLPGEEGEFAILDFHQSMLSTLKEGLIKIYNTSMPIKSGIALVKDDNLLVLVEK